MSSSRAGSLGERLRAAAAWAALLVVSWQALESIRSVRDELGGRPFERHVRVLRASPEELIREKLGQDFETWKAMRAHIPSGTTVQVSFLNVRSEYKELRPRITWLGSLLYPLVLVGWPFDPARPAPGPSSKAARREYVLDLESGRDFSVWPLCEELARGPHFRLLLLGNEAR